MEKYLVTSWMGEDQVREHWSAIPDHGQSREEAEQYKIQLHAAFEMYQYTVRPVTDEQCIERGLR